MQIRGVCGLGCQGADSDGMERILEVDNVQGSVLSQDEGVVTPEADQARRAGWGVGEEQSGVDRIADIDEEQLAEVGDGDRGEVTLDVEIPQGGGDFESSELDGSAVGIETEAGEDALEL